MSQQVGFMPQRQFHVLVNMANRQHNLTVLPGRAGNFRVIEQGKVLGEVDFTPQHRCIRRKGRLRKSMVNQLENHISNYYSLFKELLSLN
jgi:hypothetical protein